MIWLVLLFGLVLRLISLNQSFWLDEATTANVATMKMEDILAHFSPGDFHPPLYYLVAHFWSNLFGISEISLRIISILAGLGTIYVVYLIGREIRSTKLESRNKSKIQNSNELNFFGFRISDFGFPEVAALLLATSGLHIYYSQEARMYSLGTLLVSYLVYLFMKIIKRGRGGEWLLFSIILASIVMTDYVAALIIPALWIYAWRQELKPDWWRKFFTSHIILIGTGVLWLPTFLKQLAGGLAVRSVSPAWWQVLGQTNFKQLILIPTKFIFGRINMQANPIQIAIVGTSFLVFGYLLIRAIRRIGQIRLIWMWLVIPLILGSLISFWIPTLSYFRYLFVIPAFYLLVAAGLKNFSIKLSRVLIVVLTGFNLFTSSFYLFSFRNHREDWRGLTRFIKSESTSRNSAVVFPSASQQEAYRYYDKDAKILTPETLDKSYNQLWLVRYVYEISDPSDVARSKIEDLGYMKVDERDFNGVVVWRYQK